MNSYYVKNTFGLTSKQENVCESPREKDNLEDTKTSHITLPDKNEKESLSLISVKGSKSYKGKVHKFKIILLGNISVGKTSIVRQYIENKHSDDHISTIGIEFKVKSIRIDNKTSVDLQLWDTCCQERFKSITRTYYRNKNGCLLVFDLTNYNSFVEVENWLKDIITYGSKDIVSVLVGNKLDKANIENERKVTFEEGKTLAKNYNLDYFEVSALTGEGIYFMFDILNRSMIEKTKMRKEKLDETVFSILDNPKKNTNTSKCC